MFGGCVLDALNLDLCLVFIVVASLVSCFVVGLVGFALLLDVVVVLLCSIISVWDLLFVDCVWLAFVCGLFSRLCVCVFIDLFILIYLWVVDGGYFDCEVFISVNLLFGIVAACCLIIARFLMFISLV